MGPSAKAAYGSVSSTAIICVAFTEWLSKTSSRMRSLQVCLFNANQQLLRHKRTTCSTNENNGVTPMECQMWLTYRSVISSIVTEGSNPIASYSPAYYRHMLHPTSPSSWDIVNEASRERMYLPTHQMRIQNPIGNMRVSAEHFISYLGVWQEDSHLLQSPPN
jgi:hypothetical protein